MDPQNIFERWPELDRIFTEALDRASEERAGFLQEACRGDRELEAEVHRLLAAVEDSGVGVRIFFFQDDPSSRAERGRASSTDTEPIRVRRRSVR